MECNTTWPRLLSRVFNLAMPQIAKPALEISKIVKTYGANRALDGVSFTVQPGEVFGLLGPNGAGKTSLISIIISLETATAGSVKVFGLDVTEHRRQAKTMTGWVPQEVINHGFFTVREILNFHSGYFGVRQPKERVDFLMQTLGLWEHREKKVKQLSGGMKRRLMIAKALVHKPRLLLLDEPTAGVDVELRTKLWEFVEQLRREGISILLTTHYLEEAERLCDRVGIIYKGQIRALNKTRSLIEEWSRKKIIIRLRSPVLGFTHPDLIGGDGTEWIFVTRMNKPLGELLQELQIVLANLVDVQVHDGNLEDAFRKLTQPEMV